MKTRFKILLGFLVAFLLIVLTFAILFASESAVSCEAENEIVDLEKRIEAGDLLSVYFTVLKSKEVKKGKRRFSVTGDSYQIFTITCPFSKNSSTDYTLPFIVNILQFPIQAEMYTSFEAANFLERNQPFHAQNFPTPDSIKVAGKAFILSKHFSKEMLESYLTAHGFYIHQEGINSEGDKTQGFIREPFVEGSIFQKLGGNASPNPPPFICITYSDDGTLVKSVDGHRHCDFNWNLYVTQKTEMVKGDVKSGRNQN